MECLPLILYAAFVVFYLFQMFMHLMTSKSHFVHIPLIFLIEKSCACNPLS